MLNIFLCDDEKKITDQLSKYIDDYYSNTSIEYKVNICNSGLELKELIEQRKNMDILFLDIDLKDSNGITLARKIRTIDKKVKIIFISNHKNFKSAAFSVRAFGYVDKPTNKEQIHQHLEDIKNYSKAETDDIILKFETMEGFININIKDIIYFESSNRKIYIHTFSNTYKMNQQISKLYTNMSPYNFERPHSSFLVNLDYVIGIKNYIVYMVKDIEIPLSQRKSTKFHQAVDHYLAHTINICKGAQDHA